MTKHYKNILSMSLITINNKKEDNVWSRISSSERFKKEIVLSQFVFNQNGSKFEFKINYDMAIL
jgi:hypothetical protein